MLGTFCSCSAQKELQQERCNVLNNVFKDKAFKIDKQILPASKVRVRGVMKIDMSNYFKVSTMNTMYVNAPMYRFQVESWGDFEELYSLFTQADLEYMRKQFGNSDNMSLEYFKDCYNSSDIFSKSATKGILNDYVSLPLFSKDKKKCMFFSFSSFSTQLSPTVHFCKKENGKWKRIAYIDGSIYAPGPFDE